MNIIKKMINSILNYYKIHVFGQNYIHKCTNTKQVQARTKHTHNHTLQPRVYYWTQQRTKNTQTDTHTSSNVVATNTNTKTITNMTHTQEKNDTHNTGWDRMPMNGVDGCSGVMSYRGARKEGVGVLTGARTTMFDTDGKQTTRKRKKDHHKNIKKKTQPKQKQRNRTQKEPRHYTYNAKHERQQHEKSENK